MDIMDMYILDEHGNPKLERDLMAWATWYGSGDCRRVARTQIGQATVSTVFLALDHNWSGGPPVLWETMIFGGPATGEMMRYTSREEALIGHAEMVTRCMDAERQMESKSTGKALARKTQPNGDESH
jgi:hypothetical protein